MKIGIVFGLAVAAISILPTLAQSRHAVRTRNLELRIEAENVRSGVPSRLTLRLINISDHAIIVPTPTPECADQFRGSISIQLDFTPTHPNPESLGYGHGCGEGVSDWPPILNRIKEWKTLRPEESITIVTTAKDWMFDFIQLGRYKVWAAYDSPEVSQRDQEQLLKAGIDFPHQKLASNHLNFTTSR
jgi:hypothetical protein